MCVFCDGCCSALDEVYFQAPEGGAYSPVPVIWKQSGSEVWHKGKVKVHGEGQVSCACTFSQGVRKEVLCNIEGEQSNFPVPDSRVQWCGA